MAQKKRDLLDEIIDLQADWNALSRKGDELVEQFTADPNDLPVFDPDDYLERPRPNSTYCVSGAARDPQACNLCMAACPVDAITLNGASLRVGDACIKCGLCAAVCPTESFQIRKNAPMALYDKVARVATAYEQCYLTCVHALDRMPQVNEIVLPCVGAIPREVWFDLLCEYPNLSVYLPLGLCDECDVSTGEELFSNAIADAEEWSGESVGLEVDEADLGREQKRAYKRSQFVSGMTQAGTRLVTRGNPALAGAQAVANKVRAHSNQITELQKTLERAVGSQSSQSKRRMLTRKRRLVMAGLQKYPDLAEDMLLPFPQVDVQRCTMCGDCARACTVHALELDATGRVLLEPTYCVNCGACAVACPESAIVMVTQNAEELVVPDEKAKERERQRARTQKLRKTGKKTLERGLDLIEGLADDE